MECQQAICWSSGIFHGMEHLIASLMHSDGKRGQGEGWWEEGVSTVPDSLGRFLFAQAACAAMRRWGLAATALCGAAAVAFLSTGHAASPLDVAQVCASKAGRLLNHTS